MGEDRERRDRTAVSHPLIRAHPSEFARWTGLGTTPELVLTCVDAVFGGIASVLLRLTHACALAAHSDDLLTVRMAAMKRWTEDPTSLRPSPVELRTLLSERFLLSVALIMGRALLACFGSGDSFGNSDSLTIQTLRDNSFWTRVAGIDRIHTSSQNRPPQKTRRVAVCARSAAGASAASRGIVARQIHEVGAPLAQDFAAGATDDARYGFPVATVRSSTHIVWSTGDPSPMYGAIMN